MALNQVGLERLNTATTKKIGMNKNLIINGGMTVAQRATTASGVGGGAAIDACDRWKRSIDLPGGVSTLTISQETDSPDGFSNSLKVTPNQARNTALSGADRFFLNYIIEAKDIRNSGWDYTDSNSKLTLSFYIKSNLTGVVSIEVRAHDAPNNQSHFHRSVTINSANTWERKTVTIIGNSNLVFNDDTGEGLSVSLHYAAGPTFTSGTFTSGVWQDNTAGNRSSSSNIDIFSSASNFVSLTGVQLELGSVATDFEHRSFAQELALCQRYCCKWHTNGASTNNHSRFLTGYYGSSTSGVFFLTHPVSMRATDGRTLTHNITNIESLSGGGNSNNLSLLTDGNSNMISGITVAGLSGVTQFDTYVCRISAQTDWFIIMDSEL